MDIEFSEILLYYTVYKVNSKKIKNLLSELKKAVTIKYKENIMVITKKLEQNSMGKGIKSVALNMSLKNTYIKLISKLTRMTIEKINKLKDN